MFGGIVEEVVPFPTCYRFETHIQFLSVFEAAWLVGKANHYLGVVVVDQRG